MGLIILGSWKTAIGTRLSLLYFLAEELAERGLRALRRRALLAPLRLAALLAALLAAARCAAGCAGEHRGDHLVSVRLRVRLRVGYVGSGVGSGLGPAAITFLTPEVTPTRAISAASIQQ